MGLPPDRHVSAIATYTRAFAFQVSPSPTDFHRATTKNFHPTVTVHQLEPTPQSPLLETAPSFFPLT